MTRAILEVNRADAPIAEFEIRQAWEKYQTLEHHGLAFGKVCYERRAKSEVVQGGTTFRKTLDKLGIPKSTAYYWISRHEESAGLQQKKTQVIAKGGFWETLFHQLNTLVPSSSDGAEHKTAALLQKMTTETAVTKAEVNFRGYTISLLKQISTNFAEYAEQLSAEVVQ
jgi:transposase-like protein